MPEKELLAIIGKKKDKLAAIIEHTSNLIETIGNNKGGSHDNLTAAFIEVECNSLMKVKMSKTVKIIIAILAVLLTLSVSFNIYFAITSCRICPTQTVKAVVSKDSVCTNKVSDEKITEIQSKDIPEQ